MAPSRCWSISHEATSILVSHPDVFSEETIAFLADSVFFAVESKLRGLLAENAETEEQQPSTELDLQGILRSFNRLDKFYPSNSVVLSYEAGSAKVPLSK